MSSDEYSDDSEYVYSDDSEETESQQIVCSSHREKVSGKNLEQAQLELMLAQSKREASAAETSNTTVASSSSSSSVKGPLSDWTCSCGNELKNNLNDEECQKCASERTQASVVVVPGKDKTSTTEILSAAAISLRSTSTDNNSSSSAHQEAGENKYNDYNDAYLMGNGSDDDDEDLQLAIALALSMSMEDDAHSHSTSNSNSPGLDTNLPPPPPTEQQPSVLPGSPEPPVTVDLVDIPRIDASSTSNINIEQRITANQPFVLYNTDVRQWRAWNDWRTTNNTATTTAATATATATTTAATATTATTATAATTATTATTPASTPTTTINFQHLITHFGHVTAPVTNCKSGHKIVLSVSEFLTQWQQGQSLHRYMKDWHLVRDFPTYNAYTTPSPFATDWLNDWWVHPEGRALWAQMNQLEHSNNDYRFCYMGCKGTWTGLHHDVMCSFSWSANVIGRKLWRLFSPTETHKLYHRQMKDQLVIDTRTNMYDANDYPHVSSAIYAEIVQEEGEIMFVPSGWHHQVHNIDDCISINHNWLNGCCIGRVWEYVKGRWEATKAVICHLEEAMDAIEFAQCCSKIMGADIGLTPAEFVAMLAFWKRRLRTTEFHNSNDSARWLCSVRDECQQIWPHLFVVTVKEAAF